MESSKDLVIATFRNVGIAARPMFSMMKSTRPFPDKAAYTEEETNTATTLLAVFSRFIEITAHVFFRALEQYEFGDVSETQGMCFERMKKKAIITDPDLWAAMICDGELAFGKIANETLFPACNRVLSIYLAEIIVFFDACEPLVAAIEKSV